MVIGKIKLTGNLPSWYDSVNNIHLMKGKKEEREITDKHNFDSIQKGVDAGKIVFIPVEKPIENKPKAKKKKSKKVTHKAEEVHVDINVINENIIEGDDKE